MPQTFESSTTLCEYRVWGFDVLLHWNRGYISMTLIQNMRSDIILTALFTFLSIPATAPVRYTNRPLNGYACFDNYFENLTDVPQSMCVHRCLSNQQCNTLSYNPVGSYCLLGSEPCPSAKRHPEFMLMVFRYKEHRDCISWIPKHEDNTTDRLVVSSMGIEIRVSRVNSENDLYPGFATPPVHRPGVASGIMAIATKTGETRTFTTYDVLVVSTSCSLAWAPYKATERLPDRVVQTGFQGDVAVYSIMMPRDVMFYGWMELFGFYVAGENVGYFPELQNGQTTTTEMYILVEV